MQRWASWWRCLLQLQHLSALSLLSCARTSLSGCSCHVWDQFCLDFSLRGQNSCAPCTPPPSAWHIHCRPLLKLCRSFLWSFCSEKFWPARLCLRPKPICCDAYCQGRHYTYTSWGEWLNHFLHEETVDQCGHSCSTATGDLIYHRQTQETLQAPLSGHTLSHCPLASVLEPAQAHEQLQCLAMVLNETQDIWECPPANQEYVKNSKGGSWNPFWSHE